jgi:hypothetical protein
LGIILCEELRRKAEGQMREREAVKYGHIVGERGVGGWDEEASQFVAIFLGSFSRSI